MFDSDDLYSAIEESEYAAYRWRSYLNRNTGETVHLNKDEEQAADVGGADKMAAVLDLVFTQAEIDAAPDVWIEIPKYDRVAYGRDGHDKFIREFLQKHGIEGLFRL